MSKFFKALKQAERDRALRKQAEANDRDQNRVEPSSSPTPPLTPHASPLTPRDDATPLSPSPSPPSSPPDRGEAFSNTSPRPHVGGEGEGEEGAPSLQPPGIDPHLVSLLQPTCFEAEQYRALRHLIEQVHLTSGVSLVGISSPSVGDGKTITAINLAGTLAQGPKARVLLIETDLRRPSLTRYLGFGHGLGGGLIDAILEPTLPLDTYVRICSQFNLAVLPAGRPQLTSYELLNSPRFEALLDEARKQYDYVVLDTPPLIPLSDCRLIMKMVDTLILVVAAHRTPRKLVEEALNLLDPAKVLGIVFNNDDRPLAGYYYKYDKYDDRHNSGNGCSDGTAGRLRQLLRRTLSGT